MLRIEALGLSLRRRHFYLNNVTQSIEKSIDCAVVLCGVVQYSMMKAFR